MTTRERIEEYDMRMPIEEMVGFRLRLAYGSAAIPAPAPEVESAKILVEGEWVALDKSAPTW